MIIGISGKKRSGKNTTSLIIQWLMSKEDVTFDTYRIRDNDHRTVFGGWREKSFAHKIKVQLADTLGCSIDDLYDEDFKNKELGEEWRIYQIYDYKDETEQWVSITKENYVYQEGLNIFDIRSFLPTPRYLLQHIGTDMAQSIHPNFWINALMVDYKPSYKWIINDIRFPHELDLDYLFVIRINRDSKTVDNHYSERALNSHKFEIVVENNGTIEELINQIKAILINKGLLNE